MMKKISYCLFSLFLLINSNVAVCSSAASGSSGNSNGASGVNGIGHIWTKEKAIKDVVNGKLLAATDEEKAEYSDLLREMTKGTAEYAEKRNNYDIILGNVRRCWDILSEIKRICSEAASELAVWAASCPVEVQSANGATGLTPEQFKKTEKDFRELIKEFVGDPFKLFAGRNGNNNGLSMTDMEIGEGNITKERLLQFFRFGETERNAAAELKEKFSEGKVFDYLSALREVIEACKKLAIRDDKSSREALNAALRRLKNTHLKTLEFFIRRPPVETRRGVGIQTDEEPAPEVGGGEEEEEIEEEEEEIIEEEVQEQELAGNGGNLEERNRERETLYKFALYGAAQFVMFCEYLAPVEKKKKNCRNSLEEILLGLKNERDEQGNSRITTKDELLNEIFSCLKSCHMPRDRKKFERRLISLLEKEVSNRCKKPINLYKKIKGVNQKDVKSGEWNGLYKSITFYAGKNTNKQLGPGTRDAINRYGLLSKGITNKDGTRGATDFNTLARFASNTTEDIGVFKGVEGYGSRWKNEIGGNNSKKGNTGKNGVGSPRHSIAAKLMQEKNGIDLVKACIIDCVSLLFGGKNDGDFRQGFLDNLRAQGLIQVNEASSGSGNGSGGGMGTGQTQVNSSPVPTTPNRRGGNQRGGIGNSPRTPNNNR